MTPSARTPAIAPPSPASLLATLARVLPREHADRVLFCLHAMGPRPRTYIEISTGIGAAATGWALACLERAGLVESERPDRGGGGRGAWSIAPEHADAVAGYATGLGYAMVDPPGAAGARRKRRIRVMGRCR